MFSLERKIVAGFSLAVAILCTVGFVSFGSMRQFAEDAQWVSHTQEILTVLNQLESDLMAAVAGTRGFTVTGSETYLAEYNSLVESHEATLGRLYTLIADNPNQQKRLNLLRPLIKERLEVAKNGIQVRRTEGLAGSQKFAAKGVGKGYDDKIRGVILEMKAEEGRLMQLRQKRASKAAAFTREVIVGATLLAVGCLWVAFIIIRRDLLTRQRIEQELARTRDEALESARLKSRFLANMSHEIRTPMNGVIGMTSLMLSTTMTEEQREFAETIRNSGESLLTIINDILDFSKIEAGKLDFETLDLNLREVVQSTLEVLAETAQRKGIELVGLVAPDAPDCLRGDPSRIRQVLTNLASNAIKFTSAGEVTVRIAQEAVENEMATVRFSVTDTGAGIDEEAQKRLFSAFHQGDASTTRKYGGTGLGLAICKQLVEKMGGRIGADTTLGKGSTFWFTLTLPVAQETPRHRDHHLVDARILIVDDNAASRESIGLQIKAWKLEPDEAASGPEALDRLRTAARGNAPFTLTILDQNMPEMDGLMLAKAIKADPLISSTRLILLTDFGRRLSPELLAEAGIFESRSKPPRQSALFDSLSSALADSPRDSVAPPPPKPEPAPPQTERILVADDNRVNQKVTQGQLRVLGYDSDVVANGLEVLQALEHGRYDIVFMDCQMPDMDGYEATAAIREREKAGIPRTWIIAMTANAIEGDREECLTAGMDDYVSKPVRMNELGAALKRAQNRTAAAV